MQVNDWLSFLGPPWSCSNPYFVLKVIESPKANQVTMVKSGNGVWWWSDYKSETCVWITSIWCLDDVWMIEIENTQVDLKFGAQG